MEQKLIFSHLILQEKEGKLAKCIQVFYLVYYCSKAVVVNGKFETK